VGPFGPGPAGGLQPDAGAAADHHDGLPGQRRFAVGRGYLGCGGHDLISPLRALSPATKISEKVGNGWITSRSTSSGTRALTASVTCCIHSPASGPSA